VQNRLFRKGIVLVIILLFIVVNIQPAIAKLSIITTSDNEDDCNLCPKNNREPPIQCKILWAIYNYKIVKIRIFEMLIKIIPFISIKAFLFIPVVIRYARAWIFSKITNHLWFRYYCGFYDYLFWF